MNAFKERLDKHWKEYCFTLDPEEERLPFRSSNDILGMEGVACVLKRDAKIFGVGVAEKGV